MPASAPYVKFLVELQGGTGPIRLCTPQLFQDVQPWRHNSCLRAENHPNRRIVRQTAFMRLWPGVAAPGPVGKNVGAGRQRSGADRACRQGPRHGTGRTPGDGFAAAGASGPRHLHIAFRGLGQGGFHPAGCLVQGHLLCSCLGPLGAFLVRVFPCPDAPFSQIIAAGFWRKQKFRGRNRADISPATLFLKCRK